MTLPLLCKFGLHDWETVENLREKYRRGPYDPFPRFRDKTRTRPDDDDGGYGY